MSYIDQLKAEIQAKEKELGEVLSLIEKSKALMAEVEHMKEILFLAQKPGKKTGITKGNGAKTGGRQPRTEEQKKAQSERMAAYWAAKKAGDSTKS